MILLKLLWGNVDLSLNELSINNTINLSQLIESSNLFIYLKHISLASLVVFFWAVAFFKLKEKQV